MTDIATTLAQARAKLAAWQADAATAAASGAAQSQAADAAWDAVAAIEAATAQAEGLRAQILARNDSLGAALAARSAALASADKARSEGATPPIADATATALRAALVSATGLTAAKLDGANLKTAVEAVKAIRPTIFYPYHYGEVEEKTDIDRLARELEGVTEVRIRPME